MNAKEDEMPKKAITLRQYIKDNYGTQRAFAKALGVKPHRSLSGLTKMKS